MERIELKFFIGFSYPIKITIDIYNFLSFWGVPGTVYAFFGYTKPKFWSRTLQQLFLAVCTPDFASNFYFKYSPVIRFWSLIILIWWEKQSWQNTISENIVWRWYLEISSIFEKMNIPTLDSMPSFRIINVGHGILSTVICI